MPFPGNFYWQGENPANFVTFCNIGRAGLLLPKRKCLPKKSCSQFAAHYIGRQRLYLYFCPKGFDCLGSCLGRIQHLPLFQESLQFHPFARWQIPPITFRWPQCLSDYPETKWNWKCSSQIYKISGPKMKIAAIFFWRNIKPGVKMIFPWTNWSCPNEMRLRGGAEDDNGNIAGIPSPQISLPPQPHCTEHPLLFEIIISDHFAPFQTFHFKEFAFKIVLLTYNISMIKFTHDIISQSGCCVFWFLPSPV